MNKKTFVWIVVLLLLAGAVYYIVAEVQRRAAAEKEEKKKGGVAAVAVEAADPVRTSIEDRRIFTGTLKPGTLVEIAPKVGGRLQVINYDVGDAVKGGTVIAKIEDVEYKQSVDQAAADLEVAKAQLRQAEVMLDLRRREYERYKALDEKKATTQALLESAETAFHAQEATHRMQAAEVNRREAILDNAKLKLADCIITADWPENETRYVGHRFYDQGALLSPNQTILTIAEIDPLLAVIYVIERDYPYVKIDQEAALRTDAYPSATFKGRIVRIAQLLEDNTRQAAVQLEIPNKDLKLKPGMFVRVELIFASRANTTVVPRNAVVRRDGKYGVFQLDIAASKVQFVPVEVGISSGERIEILSPAVEKPVITLGNHLLTHDVPVILPARFRPAAAVEGEAK